MQIFKEKNLISLLFQKEHDRYRDFNFGAIEISWNERDLSASVISLQVKDYDAKSVLKREIKLKELSHVKVDNGHLYDYPYLYSFLRI